MKLSVCVLLLSGCQAGSSLPCDDCREADRDDTADDDVSGGDDSQDAADTDSTGDTDMTRVLAAPHLRSLSLHGDLSNATVEQIGRLAELRKLNLGARYITDAGLTALRSLEHLEELKINSSDLTDEALPFLARLPRLRALDLSGNGSRFSTSGIARFGILRPDVVVRWYGK